MCRNPLPIDIAAICVKALKAEHYYLERTCSPEIIIEDGSYKECKNWEEPTNEIGDSVRKLELLYKVFPKPSLISFNSLFHSPFSFREKMEGKDKLLNSETEFAERVNTLWREAQPIARKALTITNPDSHDIYTEVVRWNFSRNPNAIFLNQLKRMLQTSPGASDSQSPAESPFVDIQSIASGINSYCELHEALLRIRDSANIVNNNLNGSEDKQVDGRNTYNLCYFNISQVKSAIQSETEGYLSQTNAYEKVQRADKILRCLQLMDEDRPIRLLCLLDTIFLYSRHTQLQQKIFDAMINSNAFTAKALHRFQNPTFWALDTRFMKAKIIQNLIQAEMKEITNNNGDEPTLFRMKRMLMFSPGGAVSIDCLDHYSHVQDAVPVKLCNII